MKKILVDISDIQFGFSGIIHDLIGHIRILQSLPDVEVHFLYFNFYKFSIHSKGKIDLKIRDFCNHENLFYTKTTIYYKSFYYEKLSKFARIFTNAIDTQEYDYLLVQPNFNSRISEKTKLLVRLHDVIYLSNPEVIKNSWLNKRLFFESLNFLIKTASPTFLANSNSTIKSFQKYFPEYTDIKKIHCPISEPNYLTTEMSFTIPKLYFLFCSAIEPKKNIIFLCEVFKKFQLKHPEYSLVIVGKIGWKFKTILNTIQKIKSIIWLQKVSDAERDLLYKNAQCFIFPSIIEGFGMPPLEAMQSNIPVISSDIPVHREIQGDGAWYAELNDESAFLERMEWIVSPHNKEAIEEKKANAKRWVERYSLENVKKQWKEIIN